MADVTYSQLTAADPLTGAEVLGVEQSGATRKATPAQIKTYTLANTELRKTATLDLDFASDEYSVDTGEKTKTTDASTILTVTRASPKWVEGPNGLLREVPIDTVARQWRQGKPQGALIEESRTNLLLWSEDFTNAVWDTTRASASISTEEGPASGSYWNEITENVDAGNHFTRQTHGIASAAAHTFSFYAKPNGRNTILAGFSPSGPDLATIDLSSGAVTEQGLDITASAELTGSGACLITLSTADIGATGSYVIVYVVNDSGDVIYTGDGTSGIYIWGAQLEEGSAASSYIPTTTAAVTRAADDVSRTLGDEYRSDEGEIKLVAKAPVGQTLLTLGSLSIVSDLDDFKEYTLDYTTDPTATTLDVGNGNHKSLTYYPRDLA